MSNIEMLWAFTLSFAGFSFLALYVLHRLDKKDANKHDD